MKCSAALQHTTNDIAEQKLNGGRVIKPYWEPKRTKQITTMSNKMNDIKSRRFSELQWSEQKIIHIYRWCSMYRARRKELLQIAKQQKNKQPEKNANTHTHTYPYSWVLMSSAVFHSLPVVPSFLSLSLSVFWNYLSHSLSFFVGVSVDSSRAVELLAYICCLEFS